MVHAAHSPIPLLIGVTGHRQLDPADDAPLRVAMRQVFRDLQAAYPHTPLVLLSPLAAGADQIAAEVALEPESQVQLVAVLPWPPALDAELGSPVGERGRCERVLTHAAQVVVMPLPDGVTAGALTADHRQQQAQFDQCGRYIARHSQVLLAVWDGDTSVPSETAKVVRYHREGAPAPFTARVGPLDTAEVAAVCTLPVRRAASPVEPPGDASAPPAGSAGPIHPKWTFPQVVESTAPRPQPRSFRRRLAASLRAAIVHLHRGLQVSRWWSRAPQDPGERRLRERWQALDRFNQDTGGLWATASTTIARNRAYLLPDAELARQPDCVQRLCAVYALADTAAGRWQALTWRTILALFVIGLLAVASLETYAHLPHGWDAVVPQWAWLVAYLIWLATGYLLFRWTRSCEHQGRWLDNRALAEALRVQVFWRVAGLTDCVADHYLRHFRGELDWTRHAARAAYLMAGGHQSPTVETTAAQLDLVRRRWIADQQSFFTQKAPYFAELTICFETLARLAFGAAVIVAAWQLKEHITTGHLSHGLVLGTFGCLVAAALLDEFAEIHAYALLARRYHWMADLYRTALDRLSQNLQATPWTKQNATEAQQLLFDLGREALAESADWVVQHRERPPTLPSG